MFRSSFAKNGLYASLYALCVMSVHAQGQGVPANLQGVGMYELDRITDAAKSTPADKAEIFVRWMAANEWQSLDINSLQILYEWVSADSVNPRRFSARWTGFLIAPASGDYTLRQLRVYKGSDARMRVLLGGQVVLDSGADTSSEESFTSSPIRLSTGQPVPIQVDLVHENTGVVPITDFSEGAPMLALVWKAAQGSESLIPRTAFRPPDGFGEPTSQGLKGEYFGDTNFEQLRATRLDPGLDLVWSLPPVAPLHPQQASAVLDACKAKVLDQEFLVQCAAQGRQVVFGQKIPPIVHRMTLTERRQFVQLLAGNQQVLWAIQTGAIGRLIQAIYMLPGDEHLDLIGEWAQAQPQPRTVAGTFPGWGKGYYQMLNTDYYWLIGLFLQGPYADDFTKICDQYLERQDGDCNLPIAYAAAFAARNNGKQTEYLERLSERIEDQSLSGDKLMTWLLARSFAKEVSGGGINLLAGADDLESAYVVAESDDFKFWALQEMVARLSSLKQTERAKKLVDEHADRFTSPAQQAAMAKWREKADALAAEFAAQRAEKSMAANDSYVTELTRRRQAALERGDSAAAERLGELIAAAQSVTE